MTNTQSAEEFKPVGANLPKAVEFAFLLPTRMMHLTAIHPSGKRPIVGKSFNKTDSGKAAALRWLTDAASKGYGSYFNINEVTPPLDPGHPKASEADISTVYALHVDVDPPEGTPADTLQTVRAGMLSKIKTASPSLIIDSGNGYGVFFAIDPVTVTDDNLNAIKARNITLADKLGGDDCEDLCRVMRLPYTLNIPNAKKAKAGRVPVLAGIAADDRDLVACTLDDFEAAVVSKDDPSRAEKPTTTKSKSSGTAYDAIGEPEIPETVDLSKLDDALRALIVDGAAAGDDRSGVVYGVACDLRRFGWSDGDILGVLTNPSNGIADHIFDQKQREPLEQASRVIMDMNTRGVAQVFSDDAKEDFADDAPEPITPTISAEQIAEQKAERKNVAPLIEGNRPLINYRSQNMPRAVRDAMNAIRADKKHDHIFRRGPEIVRLNQNLTPAELEGKKTDLKRKRGSLVIRDVVGDYMAFRLAEAARFVTKTRPMGRPKNSEKDA